MNLTHRIINWERPRHQVILLVIRVALGIIITLKGIAFINNIDLLNSLIRHSSFNFFRSFWVWYVTLSCFLCGIFLIIGLFTRIAVIIQIPVLTGAVLFINPGEHGFILTNEFILSLVVLIALFYFLFKGSGEISMDSYLRNHEL